jgi:hypothetical protein
MVDIGIHNKNIKESWVQSKIASKVFIHESFNGATFANDIALIKLDSPVNLDGKYAIPVCLDETTPDDLDYNLLDPQLKTTWLTGWGKNEIVFDLF